MQETRGHGSRRLAVLGVLTIAGMAGCDGFDDDSRASLEATVCTSVGTTWWNQEIALQTRKFHVELAVTPSRNNTDAVVGLAPGAAAQWSGLAAIVRFNEQGTIDARAGSVYRADTAVTYQADTTYYVRFDVDVATRTYSVAVGTEAGSYPSLIGRDYAFRTEHASATYLDHVAAYVDPSVGGNVTVCDVNVVTDELSTCAADHPGGGFTNRAISAASTVSIVTFEARASTTNMDGVIGIANGPADSFGDLAAAIRFAANGTIEARDGDVYRADTAVTYVPGQSYDVKMIIDLPSKTYSVYLRNYPDYTEATPIARGYRFRTHQASVPSLDHVASIVDSTAGQLDTCDVRGGPHPRLLAVRDGTFDVQPLADGSALVSDGARTTRVDASNVPRGSIAAGGKVTADPAGNVYVASVASGALTVRAYTAALAPRWTQSYPVADSAVGDIVVTSAGHIAVALGSTSGDVDFVPAHVALIDSYGPWRGSTPMYEGAAAIAMAPNGFVVANRRPSDGVITVELWHHGAPALNHRSRQFGSGFDIHQLSIAADGSVVIGGYLGGPLVFENCSIAPFSGTEVYWTAYVASFDANLSARFCKRLTSEVTGIAHDAARIAVAYQTWTQLPYSDTVVYDPSGNVVSATSEESFVGDFGRPGRIALAADGRLYLNVLASVRGPADRRWPFLVTLSP